MAGNFPVAFNSVDLFKRVGDQATTWDLQTGEDIFAQGDKADAMFYVQSGNVKLTIASQGGKKAVTAILRKGDFFGENCLDRQAVRVATATAIQHSTISRVKRATIARIIRQEPAFAKLFISYLLTRIGRIEAGFVDQIFYSSEKRLARILLLLAGFGRQTKPEAVVAKVNQETLAEMVGTTRSRVSFFMNRFRIKGYIDYNGELRVHEALLKFLLQE
ncbi:MAG TPA: Crp/Fnr family transcriptional regulator [Clostridia bacterium]|nr:Crp/Fnr family transcriptional regulator [Clostridia bacterium]